MGKIELPSAELLLPVQAQSAEGRTRTAALRPRCHSPTKRTMQKALAKIMLVHPRVPPRAFRKKKKRGEEGGKKKKKKKLREKRGGKEAASELLSQPAAARQRHSPRGRDAFGTARRLSGPARRGVPSRGAHVGAAAPGLPPRLRAPLVRPRSERERSRESPAERGGEPEHRSGVRLRGCRSAVGRDPRRHSGPRLPSCATLLSFI